MQCSYCLEHHKEMVMSKIVKYGDFFIDPTNKRRIRKMRREVREQRIKEYTKRAEKELPLFEGDK